MIGTLLTVAVRAGHRQVDCVFQATGMTLPPGWHEHAASDQPDRL